MKRLGLTFLIVLASCSAKMNRTIIPFNNFKYLHSYTSLVNFEEIKLKSIVSKNPFYFNNLELDTSLYTYNTCLLNKEYNLVHKFPNYELRNLFCFDSISVLNKFYCVQDIISNTACEGIFIYRAYEFTLNTRNYIILLLTGSHTYTAWSLLFDISNPQEPSLVNSKEKICNKIIPAYPDFIGDFDMNGKLNFLVLSNDSLLNYEIENDNLTLIKGKYIKLIRKNNGKCFYVDLDQSSWYYIFNTKYQSGDSLKCKCCFKFLLPDYEHSVYLDM